MGYQIDTKILLFFFSCHYSLETVIIITISIIDQSINYTLIHTIQIMSSSNINQPTAFYKAPSSNAESPYLEKVLTPDPLPQLQKDNNILFPGPSSTDRDAASVPPIGTPLGDLRRQVVSLQSKINTFLTDRMEQAKKFQQQQQHEIIDDEKKNNKKLKTLDDDDNDDDEDMEDV